MIEAFRLFARKNSLLNGNKKILLAVSGGIDSVVMSTLFYESGIPFAVAHCNFGLRGKESDGDERFVKKLATTWKVPFRSIRFNTEKFALQNKISIQEAARDLRYAWFEKIRKELRCHLIATAHHLDDSVETFFIHLLRGTGVGGLAGIPVKNDHIIRPLLFADRATIEKFARAKKLTWREDSSNSSDEYVRNLLRHKLIPLLRQIQPSLGNVMQGNMARLAEASGALMQWVQSVEKQAVSKTGAGKWSIRIDKLPVDWQGFLLYHFLRDKGFDRWQADAMVQPSSKGSSGQLYYGNGYEALKNRGIVLVRQVKATQNTAGRITRRNSILRLPAGNWKVSHLPAKGFRIPSRTDTTAVDAGKLQFPLQARRWQAGDHFQPLGMKGRKKVSDFLVDVKMSRFEKENIFVILSGSDVVCILGHRIDDRYKITPSTRRILLIETHA